MLARTGDRTKAGNWLVLKAYVFRQTVGAQNSQFHVLLS